MNTYIFIYIYVCALYMVLTGLTARNRNVYSGRPPETNDQTDTGGQQFIRHALAPGSSKAVGVRPTPSGGACTTSIIGDETKHNGLHPSGLCHRSIIHRD